MHLRVLSVLFSFLVFSLLCVSTSAQQVDCSPEGFVAASASSQPGYSLEPGINGVAGQWTTAPSLLTAKCYPSAAWFDGHLYVFGGGDADLKYDTKCYKLNASTGLWSAIAPLPIRRVMSTVQTVNGKIYIIGGHSALTPTFTVQAPVLEYDPVANTYIPKANTPKPVFGAGSFVYNGRIFVLGGGTTAFTTSIDTIQIYDPASDLWTVSTTKTPYPALTSGVAAVDNTVLFVGGVRYNGTQGTFGAWAYKGVITDDNIVWTQIADYPDGSVMRFSAGSDGGKMYFSSGHNAGSQNNGPPSGKTFSYNPVSDTWTMMDQKPTPVYYSSQMIFDGNESLYMVGGYDAPSHVTAAVEALNVNAAGGPLAYFAKSTIDTWLKLGGSRQENFPLTNNGSAALTWEATVVPTAGTWLSLATMTGQIPAGETVDLWAVLNSAEGNGVHVGKIAVITNDPAKPMTELTITLHVQAEDVDADQNVLMEEGTGTWCGYCPYGADSLKAVIQRYPGRVQGISYHSDTPSEPMQTPSTTFWKNLIKLSGWPQGSVNRVVFKGQSAMALSRAAWNASIAEVLQTRRSPISLNVLAKTYHPASKSTSLTVEILFHRDVAAPIRLNIAQVQDQMNYTQVFYPPAGGSTKLYPYYHDHVLRQMIPNDAGEVVSGGIPVASQTRVTKTFNFTSVDSTVETSRFIIFAHYYDGTTFGEIVQSTELDLSAFVLDVQPLPANASFTLHQNYPNPFNPSTMVSFDLPTKSGVTLSVTDYLGREVERLVDDVLEPGRHSMSFDAASLPSGTYLLILRSGDVMQTRSMTLVR